MTADLYGNYPGNTTIPTDKNSDRLQRSLKPEIKERNQGGRAYPAQDSAQDQGSNPKQQVPGIALLAAGRNDVAGLLIGTVFVRHNDAPF